MKKAVLWCVALLATSCYEVERNCENFHTGTFSFTQVVGTEVMQSTFVRDELYEVELFKGKKDTATIRWINACECVLTKLNPTSNQDKRPISIKIIKTEGDRYTFEYALVGDLKNKQRGEIVKVSDDLEF